MSLTIDGTEYAYNRADTSLKILRESLHITDARAKQQPATAQFSTFNLTPTRGQEVTVSLGGDRIFGGRICRVQRVYRGTPQYVIHHVECMDHAWPLMWTTVAVRYTATSATEIALDLIATYAPAGYYPFIEAGLDEIDEISFSQDTTLWDAMQQLAKRFGGYCVVDYYKGIHLYTTWAGELPDPINAASSGSSGSTAHWDFAITEDETPRITRAYVEGGGGSVLSDLSAGETIIPIDAGDWYDSNGGLVTVGADRVSYTGAQTGGSGSLVGPGATPPSAPLAVPAAGTGLSLGDYEYAYTDVTGTGESLPSPLATITLAAVSGPATAPTFVSEQFGNGPDGGDIIEWACTFVSAVGETIPGPRSTAFDAPYGPGDTRTINLSTFPIGPSGTTARKLYRSLSSGGTLFFVKTISDNVTTSGQDDVADASLGAAAPSSNPTALQVSVTAIAVGPASVTSRKLYRTVVSGSQLKLVTTLADNVTTIYTDSTPDGSLGANVPTSDTSGLTQSDGQVNAGSSTLAVASAGPFSASGGWALLSGGQVIRYTGTSGNTLTGIPTSGIGAILATVTYNATVAAAFALTGVPASGVGSIRQGVTKGDPVNLLVYADDIVAQAQVAAVFGGTGIIEDYTADGRLSRTEALARAQARLGLSAEPLTTAAYKCRDRHSFSGVPVHVDLSAMTAFGDFLIQQVEISGFHETDDFYPTFAVTASSTRSTFEDLLRLTRKALKAA